MTVAALSTAGFSQYISASSNLSASQQALQTLGQSLGAGNLSGAISAFNTYKQINQNLTNASSTSSSSSSTTTSKLTTDMNALDSALNSGNLGTAQSTFASMQSDLATTPSQAMANATAAANQTVQWIDDMLSLSSPAKTTTSYTASDLANTILNDAYGVSSSTSSTDPAIAMVQNALNTAAENIPSTSSTSAASTTASTTAASTSSTASSAPSYATHGNLGSAASVNAYA